MIETTAALSKGDNRPAESTLPGASNVAAGARQITRTQLQGQQYATNTTTTDAASIRSTSLVWCGACHTASNQQPAAVAAGPVTAVSANDVAVGGR